MRSLVRIITLVTLICVVNTGWSQKKQLRAAWRALSDYEETQREGRSAGEFLAQARQSIDLSAALLDTRNETKTL